MERFRSVLRYGLFALVFLTPLPFGCVQPRSVLVLELAAALLGGGALVLLVLERWSPGPRALACTALLAAVILVGVLQLLPLPQGVVSTLATPVSEARGATAIALESSLGGPAPASLSAPDTLDAVLRLCCYLLIGVTALATLRERRDLQQAAMVVVASATFQALYGSFEYLSGRQQIFGYVKSHYLDSATGTFINRNHFAGYLAMALPLAMGLTSSTADPSRHESREPAGGRGWRGDLLRFGSADVQRRLLGLFAAVVIWIGVILSYSRAGLAVALLASVIAGTTLGRGRRRWALALLGTLLLPTVYLMYLDVNAPGARLGQLGRDLAPTASRPLVWKATARIAADLPWTGSGLGTFENAFPAYRPPGVRAHWDHAHNDWLQAAAGGGVLVPAAFVALAWLLLYPRRDRGERSSALRVVSGCAAAGIAAMALHSLVDFSLRIPAVPVLLVILAAIRLGSDRLLRAAARPSGLRPA